jgi:ABC-type glutathione transport system ATPase component
MSTALIEATGVSVTFGAVVALDNVDLSLPEGPYGVGLVGESGSGKSTAARVLLRLISPTNGQVTYRGDDVRGLRGPALKEFRRQVQVVFQDPDGTLDPRMRVGQQIAEVLRVHRVVPAGEIAARVDELLEDVGLQSGYARHLPSQLSGGQRQRVAIARALALRPRVLILDEPTSALDVTTQIRILDLIERLRAEHGLSYLLISHNLAVVERLCEDVAVLYRGRVVERGSAGTLLATPTHPYTAALLAAVPRLPGTRRRPGDGGDDAMLQGKLN